MILIVYWSTIFNNKKTWTCIEHLPVHITVNRCCASKYIVMFLKKMLKLVLEKTFSFIKGYFSFSILLLLPLIYPSFTFTFVDPDPQSSEYESNLDPDLNITVNYICLFLAGCLRKATVFVLLRTGRSSSTTSPRFSAFSYSLHTMTYLILVASETFLHILFIKY